MADDLLEKMEELQDSVINVLEMSLATPNSTTCIITNGEAGWVQLSCQKFMPRVLPYIEKISVCSARSTYESQYPNSPNQWKIRAFKEHVKVYGGPNCRTVISFGDSQSEREAVQLVTK